MNRINLFLFFSFALFSVTKSQTTAIGVGMNAGYTSRLNASLNVETHISRSLYLKGSFSYGNLLPFNTKAYVAKMLPVTSFDKNADNLHKHIELNYQGYRVTQSKSTISAPEFKVGVLIMSPALQKKRNQLSGLYFGYQLGIAVVTQTYVNTYTNEKTREDSQISGTANYFAINPVSLFGGYKMLIAKNTTLDLGIEQNLYFVYTRKFKPTNEFYFNPYSKLKFDLNVGIRRVF
jgi:hypothetical protein